MIKLRVYIKTLKLIVPVSRINFDCETIEVDISSGNGDLVEYDFDEAVIMQYTGLKDKNGAEIYGGDIVRCICPEGSFTATVEFGNPNGLYSWGWQLKPIGGTNFNPDILLWVETELYHVTCEIIGNIHDNPELLS